MREALRSIPLLSELSEDDLDLLAAGACEETVSAGTVIFAEGDEGDRACVITEGEVEVLKTSGAKEVLLAVRKAGEIIGEMSLLDSAPRMASVRARSDTTFLTIPKQQMDDLLQTSATAARALFGVLLSRWRETESSLRQSERMAQIGTLTAGLAHEMNNPAAAVRRGSSQLDTALGQLSSSVRQLGAVEMDPAAASKVDALLEAASEPAEPIGALERADREAEIEAVLSDLGVADPWRLAPIVATTDVSGDDLIGALGTVDGGAASRVVAAFCALAESGAMVREIAEGAERLSAIVGALKSYSYLDQAEVQEVDVRKGLDDTVLILKHKLADIEVRREYPEQAHLIQAYAGALNQVWTNLIDNAADALLDSDTTDPVVVLRVSPAGDGVQVEVEDNGPGIPPDKIDRVFDAFFTTKPPGSGTGLGLDISYGTVVHRHGGDITVESQPGSTVFRVALPGDAG